MDRPVVGVRTPPINTTTIITPSTPSSPKPTNRSLISTAPNVRPSLSFANVAASKGEASDKATANEEDDVGAGIEKVVEVII